MVERNTIQGPENTWSEQQNFEMDIRFQAGGYSKGIQRDIRRGARFQSEGSAGRIYRMEGKSP